VENKTKSRNKKIKMAKKSKPNPRYTSKKAGKIKPNLLAMRKARRRTIRARKRPYKSSKGGRKRNDINAPYQPIFNFPTKSKFF
jgi:hypothetical protein